MNAVLELVKLNVGSGKTVTVAVFDVIAVKVVVPIVPLMTQ